MKPTSPFTIERRLDRHDPRVGDRRAFPATDYFLHSPEHAAFSPSRPRPGDIPTRAFRRMTAQMLASKNRHETLEMVVFAFVTAITAWPLVSLLILLAQTVNG